MSIFEGSAAVSLDHPAEPATARPAERNEARWAPAEGSASPALDLQRQLHASLMGEIALPEIDVPPAERLLRGFSRAAGYVSLAGAVAFLGWLIF